MSMQHSTHVNLYRVSHAVSSSSPQPLDTVAEPHLVVLEEHNYDAINHQGLQQNVLTSSPCLRSRRLSRPLDLPSAPTRFVINPSNFAIQSIQNNFIDNINQDVLPLSDVAGSSYLAVPPYTQYGFYYQDSLESKQLPSTKYPALQNGSINPTSNRPRTSYPVFQSTSELAAHHGIPQHLPPIPISNKQSTNQLSPTAQQIEHSALQDPTDFYINSYLNMIAKSENTNQADSSAPPVPSTPMETTVDASAGADEMQAMFDINMTPEWSSYLTSPFDESPFDALLATPVDGSADYVEFLSGPIIEEWNDLQDQLLVSNPIDEYSQLAISKNSTQQLPGGSIDMEGLLTMSPYTPALDPLQTMFPSTSSRTSSSNTTTTITSRPTKKKPTGTRKNVTPTSLVPLEAPTQQRAYASPSATSRKQLPAVFAKKRIRSMAFDEEDELIEEITDPNVMPPTASEAQAIELKRRQNTIAARRSRQRKLEHQIHLEQTIVVRTQERDEWRHRAVMLRNQLRGMGVSVPEFPPDSDA